MGSLNLMHLLKTGCVKTTLKERVNVHVVLTFRLKKILAVGHVSKVYYLRSYGNREEQW